MYQISCAPRRSYVQGSRINRNTGIVCRVLVATYMCICVVHRWDPSRRAPSALEPSLCTSGSCKNGVAWSDVCNRGTQWPPGPEIQLLRLLSFMLGTYSRVASTNAIHTPALRLGARCTVVRCCASLRQHSPIVIRSRRARKFVLRPQRVWQCFVANQLVNQSFGCM